MVRKPEELGWKISADLERLGQVHEIETSAENGSNRQVRIDGKVSSQNTLGNLAQIVWLVPSMDRLWLEGAEGRRRFLDRVTMSFHPAHAKFSLTYEKAMRERNRLLKDGVSDDAWYRALESRMATAGAEITSNRKEVIARLADVQVNAETAFPTADLTLLSRSEIEDLESEIDLAEELARNRSRDMATGRSLIGPHRADLGVVFSSKSVDAKLCSTGEQKALLISVILANARALSSDFSTPPIILLDEVAAHLDADRRASLYDEICALGSQVWLTGTDASLFEALGSRGRLFEVKDEVGGSVIKENRIK